jgi:cytolysin-activating lysine-acyltransferase
MKTSSTDPFAALGQMIWVATYAPNYRGFAVDALAASLLPAIELNQFRIYRAADGRPLAFVTWALMDEAAEARVHGALAGQTAPALSLADWRSGERIWFVDFVAPFGHARQLCADLRRNVFPGRSARALRLDGCGEARKLGEWRSAHDPLGARRTTLHGGAAGATAAA